mgnify:CR=1 FL=1
MPCSTRLTDEILHRYHTLFTAFFTRATIAAAERRRSLRRQRLDRIGQHLGARLHHPRAQREVRLGEQLLLAVVILLIVLASIMPGIVAWLKSRSVQGQG